MQAHTLGDQPAEMGAGGLAQHSIMNPATRIFEGERSNILRDQPTDIKEYEA